MKKALSLREEKAVQTRLRILEAGRTSFIEQGFTKTTISQIIKKAGLGYGTAYVYFKNKDEILIELVDELMNQFYQVAERSFVPNTVEEAQSCIQEQVELFLSLAKQEAEMMSVLNEARGISTAVAKRWSEIQERFITSITKDITFAQSKGLASNHLDPTLIARGWFYANEMFMWESVIGESHFSIQEIREQLTYLYMNGLYHK
ncbi:TetR/AcrR family transcriptional regulator [Alkalihalobacillus sp. 1P02AB]|uniref:TetR/AcrR family transcriptional regulator n=1 Tax=Alkalihalobacillus sp. 1P02AB TaxID=3132260 RepID=UPI0039A42386